MLRVVLADDEKKVLLLMRKLIDWESLGFEIVGMASDGISALDQVREKKPHLLVTDIRMPGYNGIDLIRQAKQIQPGLHFIIVSGYRQFEYPFIARAEARTTRARRIQLFRPARMQYMTLRSRPLELEITPDAKGGGGDAYVVQGRGMSKEEVKMLGQDIRFIKLGNAQLRRCASRSFSGLPTGAAGGNSGALHGVYVALRKQIRDSQNAALIRGRRANKVAIQRFRIAKNYMEEHNQHAFYEEMLKLYGGI